MIKSRLLFCVLLLFLSMHQIQVSALFNVTKEALLIGPQYKHEIEKKEDYKTLDDLDTKLSKIQKIYFSFVEKNNLNNLELAVEMIRKYFKYLKQYDLSEDIGLVYRYYSGIDTKLKYLPNASLPIHVIRISAIEKLIDENDYKLFEKSLKYLLNDYHRVLKKNNPHTGESVVTSLNKINDFELSQQEAFILFSKSIIILDAFAYNLMQYAYALYQVYSDGVHLLSKYEQSDIKEISILWKDKDIVKKMNALEHEFKQRNEDTIQFIKNSFISQMSRESWNHDDKYLFSTRRRTTTYTKLKNVFQKYIVNEVDLNAGGSCKKECSNYDRTKVHGCFNKKICDKQRTCDGNLWDCNDEIKYTMNICPSIESESSRYDFLKANGEYYGERNNEEEKKCTNNLIEVASWLRGLVYCTYCTCTCDNANIKGDRYFNLRDVTSDAELNYVVLNARFKIENNVIHIEIQQGQLLPEAEVNVTSVSWKPIDNYTIHDKQVENGKDYHTISWNQRTVCLDEITSPSNFVVTGLRFMLIDDYLKLGIRATPFDYKTGKLASNMSYWIDNDDDLSHRTELKFHEHEEDIYDLKSSQYFRFTTSDMKKDVGQNTIPFIDLEEVDRNKFLIPLSGVGIHHKSIQNIGDLLSWNLVTYDMTSHIE